MKTITKIFICFIAAIGISFAAQAKTLRLAYDADPVSLDPHEQLSGGMLQYSHMVFDPLVRWTRSMDFEPRLATSWQRIDQYTVRFNLRKNVKFHSGNTLTTKDVLFTYNRLLESPDFKALFQPFKELKVIDDYTFELITREPYPLVMHMATYIFPMDSAFYSGNDDKGQPRAMLKKHGDTYASTHASGTGPYIVTERQQGVKVEFTRFGDYWDESSPGNVDKIIMTPIKEAPTRVAALLSGDVDFIAPVPPTDLERIEKNPNTDLITMSGTRIITFQLNQKRVPQFKDQRVRQAIVYAVNNMGIVKKIMRGFGTAAAQQSPRGYVGHVPGLFPRYDLEKAKQLMKEAGYEKGFSVTMMAPNNRYVNDAKIAEAVASMLAKINIKVDLTTMPKAQYWPKFDERAADIMMIGWHADTEDSSNFTEFLTMCPDAETGYGQYNSGNYCNKDVDAMIIASQGETDLARRKNLLQDVERKLYYDAAFVPLHWQDLAWAARKGVHAEAILNVMNFPYLGDLVMD